MTRSFHTPFVAALLVCFGLGSASAAPTPAQQAAIEQVLQEHAQASAQLHAHTQAAAQQLEWRIQTELTQTQAAVFNLTMLRNELTLAAQQAAQAGDAAVVEQLLQAAVSTGVTQVQLTATQQARIQVYTAEFSQVVFQTNVALTQLRATTMARIQAILAS